MAKKKKQALWTTMVPQETVTEVHRLLASGRTSYEIAKQVQGTKVPMFPDYTPHAVAVWFNTYRNKHVIPANTKAVGTAAKVSGLVALRKRLDVLADLEDLAVINQERLRRGVKAEQEYRNELGIEVPLEEVTRLTVAYGTSLERLANLYLEVGILTRVAKKVTGSVTDLMGGRKIFEWTEEDRSRFTKAMILEGKYTEVEDDTVL